MFLRCFAWISLLVAAYAVLIGAFFVGLAWSGSFEDALDSQLWRSSTVSQRELRFFSVVTLVLALVGCSASVGLLRRKAWGKRVWECLLVGVLVWPLLLASLGFFSRGAQNQLRPWDIAAVALGMCLFAALLVKLRRTP